MKNPEKSGLEPTAPNHLADRKHCALSTQPIPIYKNRWFIGEFQPQAFQSTRETTEDVDNGHSKNKVYNLKPELLCGHWNAAGSLRLWVDHRMQPSHMSTRKIAISINDSLGKELELVERLNIIEDTSKPSAGTSALAVTRR